MFYCDQWNPVPLQSRPGLLNDPFAFADQTNNKGCFDQISVPPLFRIAGNFGGTGTILRRSTKNATGGAGWVAAALLEHAKKLFGARTGEAMWREFTGQEFAWNRNGTGNSSGADRSVALWSKFPTYASEIDEAELISHGVDPEDLEAVAHYINHRTGIHFAANLAHYQTKYPEYRPNPVGFNSVSLWVHHDLPNFPGFDGYEDSEEGYPVWAIDCEPMEPGPWGRWRAPCFMEPMTLQPRSVLAGSQTITIIPEWL